MRFIEMPGLGCASNRRNPACSGWFRHHAADLFMRFARQHGSEERAGETARHHDFRGGTSGLGLISSSVAGSEFVREWQSKGHGERRRLHSPD
jgi:hypothetical protein